MNTLRDRTKQFAIRVIRLYMALPKSDVGRVLGRQLLRSGTSPGANCREGYRSRSDAEMISKYETALQELDETLYWIELLIEVRTIKRRRR
jgi:four helix bundle protein